MLLGYDKPYMFGTPLRCSKVFEMVEQEEKDVTQVKVLNELLRKIREANSDYQYVPAKDIAHIALNHFLYELEHNWNIERRRSPRK